MHKKIEEYLNSQKIKERKRKEEEKEKLLYNLELYDKEYAENTEDVDYNKYPHSEWDEKTQTLKYYKILPISVTDEEYEEIKKHTSLATSSEQNGVATILSVIAWIIVILGFILGVVLGSKGGSQSYFSDEPEFSVTTMLICWAVSFVNGMLLLGFAEIIKLLHSINKK